MHALLIAMVLVGAEENIDDDSVADDVWATLFSRHQAVQACVVAGGLPVGVCVGLLCGAACTPTTLPLAATLAAIAAIWPKATSGCTPIDFLLAGVLGPFACPGLLAFFAGGLIAAWPLRHFLVEHARLLLRGSKPATVKHGVALSQSLGTYRTRSLLIRCAGDDGAAVREKCVEALGNDPGHPATVRALARALEDPDERVRLAAALALQYGSADDTLTAKARTQLEELAHSADADVAARAAHATAGLNRRDHDASLPDTTLQR